MLVSQSYLYGVEVLTLYVLDERHFHDVLVLDGSDVSRYGAESGYLRSPPASFAGDDLITFVGYLTQRYGLYDANLANACRQFFQRYGVKLASWLVGVSLNLRERYLVYG